MRFWKRSVSLLLALMLVLGLTPVLIQEAAAASTLALPQLQEKFPEGKYWNHYVSSESETTDALCGSGDESFMDHVSDTPCPYHETTSANTYVGDYSCNYFDHGFQCNGFVRKLAYDAFGSRVDTWEEGSLSTLKPGDVVHYYGAGAGEYWGHWVFVTAVSGTTITVGECNWDGSCRISWSRSFDLAQSTGYTVYSAPSTLKTTIEVNPYLRHWISENAMGEACAYVGEGNWGYLCCQLYDANSGAALNDVVAYSYDLTMTIYMPDGTVGHTYTFTDTDETWIALRSYTPGDYTYEITLSGDLNGTLTGSYKVYDKDNTVVRLAGENRFDTAFKVAEEMKATLGISQFDSIIIASGTNFADALSGSYLAAVKTAPILLSFNDAYNELVREYIRENLKEGGTVYILGGTAAVPASMENGLEGFHVKRLAGANRFETNLAILKEAGVGGKEILVCTGTNFADSLSASATGLPILLVYNESAKLTQSQMNFLAGLNGNAFCIIGGESAVGVNLANAVKKYGSITRLAGSDRFETSVMVAERYFYYPDSAVLAYAWNYPDGLCGGALAYSMNAPLILTMSGYESPASEYVRNLNLAGGVVLGGTSLISDDSIDRIFAMTADGMILIK